jgi:hypothetical protein
MKRGDHVQKTGGDYTIHGVIVSRFRKLSGQTRFVVEVTTPDARGLLLIYRAENLRPIKATGKGGGA